jgi:peptidoglycan-associated lipoprotein
MLAVMAGLYGCATTESQDSSTAPTPGAAPSSSAAKSGGVTPGTARAPVRQGSGFTGTTPGTRPDLKYSVYFEYDQYDVKPEFRPLVESHARYLKANPQARLVIEGNADERGSREYNVALGQRRAEAVTRMLVLLGAKPEQIEAVSWGEEKPRVTGHDEKAWSENRRDDFVQR